MREQLKKRVLELKAEFDSGQKMLTELDQKRANLEKTLLRISGAIQVLEEELQKAGSEADPLALLSANGHSGQTEILAAG
jgi:predicted nuclease with TOPRIM domain